MAKQIVILGASHRSAPVESRERLARVDDEPEFLLKALQGGPIEELAVLSTCNRVELVAVGEDAAALEQHLRQHVRRLIDVDDAWLTAFTRTYHAKDSVEHLFRVASSLDSIVVGEPQILGQVKEAYRRYARIGATGPVLNRVFHWSFRTAKMVRAQTGIAQNAVSVSYAAVELARQHFGDLGALKVLVIGAGKMGALAAKNLQQAGVHEVEVLNRDLERALALERSLGVAAGSLASLRERLAFADIVITSTGAREYVVREEDVVSAQIERSHRPLLLVDIAVPRDVDPACAQIPGVSLFDVDDLERVVLSNLDARRAAAREAETLVAQAADEVDRWLASAPSVRTVVALRERVFQTLEGELERSVRANPKLNPEEISLVESFARQLVRKILHTPTKALREAEGDEGARLAAATRALFALELDEEESEQ